MCRPIRGQSPMRAVTQSRTTSAWSDGTPPGPTASGRARPSQAPGRGAAGPPPRTLGRELASDWRGEGPTPTARHAIDLTPRGQLRRGADDEGAFADPGMDVAAPRRQD